MIGGEKDMDTMQAGLVPRVGDRVRIDVYPAELPDSTIRAQFGGKRSHDFV